MPNCPQCREELGSGAPAGLCPKCLILGAFESSAGAEDSRIQTIGTAETADDDYGRYQILRPLGEGGMGTVYLAEQLEPIRRHVALKVVKPGMDTAQVLARFNNERQALAMMDHSNIAQIFDAGATAKGRPYFVMEYIEGAPITQYCDGKRMATKERLALFLAVCRAVQHAHEKGVIHRDLKPSNVLVTEQDGAPVPKVIDFGIAKATDQWAVENTMLTQFGQIVGTPEYASPEQADTMTGDVDAASDVYSLGVLLYELLIGAVPFDTATLRNAGLAEMLRIIREDEAPSLPRKLTSLGAAASDIAARRRTDPVSLRRLVDGDLNSITMKALEKARERRYASVSDLAADIQRHLEHRPVLASPPSVLYRARKFLRRHRLAVLATAAGAGFLFLYLGGNYLDSGLTTSARRAPEPTILPAVTLPGDQAMPALSPDGSRIAFVWAHLQRSESGIYTTVLGTQSVARVTRNEGDYTPVWSPDGHNLGFLRVEGRRLQVMLVPVLGGAEKTVFSCTSPKVGYYGYNTGLSFSSDGNLLAFSEWQPSTQSSSISAVSLKDFRPRSVTAPPPGLNDRYPAYSPDGKKMAFVRASESEYTDELFVISTQGGEPRQLTFGRRIYGQPSWTPDSREIVFSSNRAGLPALWRVSASGGPPQRLRGAGPGAWYPSVSLTGAELAYENVDEETSLWRIPLRDPRHASAEASVAVQKNYNFVPQFSPDGRKIAFQSQRSGYPEVWISDADGSNLVQATDLQRFAGTPRWSPDGRYIAFDFRPGEHSEIDILDTSTGQRVAAAASPAADNIVPSWSRDGRRLYFASNLRNGFQIWRVAVKNGVAEEGSAVQVTTNGGYAAFESADGSEVLYTKENRPGIWATTPKGGREREVWGGPGPDYWSNWAVTKDGIFSLVPRPGLPPEIEFLDRQTGEVWPIAKLARASFYGFAASPDGRWLVYSQWDRNEHSILLARNFR